MPVIPQVGRRSARVRVIYGLLYALVTAGAFTAAYPLALLVARSVSSPVDLHDYRPVPAYLLNDGALFRKYAAVKYDPKRTAVLNRYYRTRYRSYAAVTPPDTVHRRLVDRWQEFRDRVPYRYRRIVFAGRGWHEPAGPVQALYQGYLLNKYGSIDAINRAYGTGHAQLEYAHIPRVHLDSYTRCLGDDPVYRDFRSFRAGLSGEFLQPIPVEGLWHRHLERNYPTVADLNRACGTAYPRLEAVLLPERAPANPELRSRWESFAREACPVAFVTISDDALPGYRAMLRRRYGTVAAYNRAAGTHIRSFGSVGWPKQKNIYGIPLADWTEYRRTVPLRHLAVTSPAGMFRTALFGEYGTISGINRALGTAYTDTADIIPPYRETDWAEFKSETGTWRRYFLLRNYREVGRELFVNSRVIPVTLAYLAGIVLLQLVVNALCAYGLSRFDLPYTYKMLAFFLVTMAFPAEVTMIPDFLLLKKLGLLNTVWALTLPMAVSGYFIFILKGYFDAVPRSLYEAAQLDGLGEFSIFRRITVPLARPILAWTALQSFMLAYSAFLFNMVVCQDAQMWTLMVWIYGMFNWATPSYIAAAAVMAAVPGVLVFLFAQRIITRGVVIPMDQ